jgi:two-component system sensor histidine kinase VicK
LTDVLRDVSSRYESTAQDKGLTLRCECPGEVLNVWGDRSELDRIMNNLVSNAIKYTKKGAVRVVAEQSDGFVRVVVADTGIGIPKDALPRLFQEFFRAKNAKVIQETGTGLGLAIVKDLVERYDGEITVDSVEEKGTTFTLSLPLAEASST